MNFEFVFRLPTKVRKQNKRTDQMGNLTEMPNAKGGIHPECYNVKVVGFFFGNGWTCNQYDKL